MAQAGAVPALQPLFVNPSAPVLGLLAENGSSPQAPRTHPGRARLPVLSWVPEGGFP